MSDTIFTSSSEADAREESRARSSVFAGRRARRFRESILAYVLLLPAFLIVFTFGIYPLAFSVYQSTLRGLNKIVGTYDGVGNYVRAIGDLAYVFGFWLGALALGYAVYTLWNRRQTAREHGDRPWLLMLPAAVVAVGFALFVRFFFGFLPQVLLIANDIRSAKQAGAEETTGQLFRQFFLELFLQAETQQSFWLGVIVLLVGGLLTYVFMHRIAWSPRNGSYFAGFFTAVLLLIGGVALLWFVWQNTQLAYAEAAAEGEVLAIWAHTVTISAGLILLGLSWIVWRSASFRDTNLSTFGRLTAAALLIIGAWVLISEIPEAAAQGDEDWYLGLLNTVYYSAGSIPFQFAISLMLATFLFQNIRGKALFRMIYFLPYITPAVGAAAIFRILFSGRVDAPANQIVQFLGFDALGWLNEPTGIFQLLIGDAVELPTLLAGPSLSLTVIIMFGIWTFVGFNTVIFLAGLGGIPSELYEAASIDGAGRWAQFRNVTLPLLSPTIYFLTLYAVIGTFKAFTHIYVLRTSAALGTADTASVVIFNAMKRDTRYGYAAALAVLLLIIVMVLTVVNNRIASRRVFYG